MIELQTNLDAITKDKESENERFEEFGGKLREQKNEMDSIKEKLHATEHEISSLQDKYDAGKRTLDQNLIDARFMAEQLKTIESTMKTAEVSHMQPLTSN